MPRNYTSSTIVASKSAFLTNNKMPKDWANSLILGINHPTPTMLHPLLPRAST